MPCLQILSFCPTTTRWLSQTSSTELRTTQLSTSPTTSVSSPGIMDILTTPGGCRTRTTNQAGLTNISVTRLDNLHPKLRCWKSTTLSENSCCAPTSSGPFGPSFRLRTPAQTSTLLTMLCRDSSSTKDGRALLESLELDLSSLSQKIILSLTTYLASWVLHLLFTFLTFYMFYKDF